MPDYWSLELNDNNRESEVSKPLSQLSIEIKVSQNQNAPDNIHLRRAVEYFLLMGDHLIFDSFLPSLPLSQV